MSSRSRHAMLVASLACLVSCAKDAPDPRPAFRFVDHVPGSSSTFTRAELPAMREEGHRAGRVTLRGETRASLLLPHGSRSSFAVDVPPNAVLRLAVAVATLTDPEFRSPVEFSVSATGEHREETLFRTSVGRAERNRWLDHEVDLSDWAGAPARIAFHARVAPEDDALFALVGNPVLSTATDGAGLSKIILVSIDCLRADHVGIYGYPRDTTPHLDAFAEDAVVFEIAIASSATTLPTHMSMFTGFTPSEHGASNRHMLSRSVPYLPELLATSGFQVDGVVSGAYLAQNFGFERGFHTYLSLRRPRAARAIDAALKVLARARGQRHFLFLHLIDAHWPYQPPEAFHEKFGPLRADVPAMLQKVLKQIPPDDPAEIQQAIDLYDAEIAYADQELGRFLDELRARGLYDDAFIIVTADHGEAFWEHANWQHGWTLYDEIVHVPLVIKWPQSAKRGRVSRQVSQTDVFATLLGHAGITPPHTRAHDVAALADGDPPSQGRRFAISEFTSNPAPGELPVKHVAIRTETFKYIATFRTDDDAELDIVERLAEELYDLGQDPGETRNLAADVPEALESFRRGLSAYLDEARAFRDWRHGDAVVEDDAIRERLRALGYLQ